MKESKLEKKLKKRIEDLGGIALKFVSPGKAGVPDRLIVLPTGLIFFVEMKAPGEKPRPLQVKRIRDLRNLGAKVYVVDSDEMLERLIDDVLEVMPSEVRPT